VLSRVPAHWPGSAHALPQFLQEINYEGAIGERWPFHQFHDDGGLAVGFFDAMDLRDVGMVPWVRCIVRTKRDVAIKVLPPVSTNRVPSP